MKNIFLLSVVCLVTMYTVDCQPIYQVLRRWGRSPFKEVTYTRDSQNYPCVRVVVEYWCDNDTEKLTLEKITPNSKFYSQSVLVYPTNVIVEERTIDLAVPLLLRSTSKAINNTVKLVAPGIELSKDGDDDRIPKPGRLYLSNGDVRIIPEEEIFEIQLNFQHESVQGSGTPLYLFRGLALQFTGFIVVLIGAYYVLGAIREERRRRREEFGHSSSSSESDSGEDSEIKNPPKRRVPVYRRPGNEAKLKKTIVADSAISNLHELEETLIEQGKDSMNAFLIASAQSISTFAVFLIAFVVF